MDNILRKLEGGDKKLRPRVMGILKELTQTGSPAVKNRGKKLIQKLEKIETG